METSTPPELEGFADGLDRAFNVDKNDLLENLSARRSISALTPRPARPVHLSPVSTFIHGAKDGRLGYVVSSMAKHWGVIVGDEVKVLYHLVFVDEADGISDANPDSLTGRTRAVQLDATYWNPSRRLPPSMEHVGDTRFSNEQLIKIGRAAAFSMLTAGEDMIAAFGDYHRVFWNCQLFAKCFLEVICEETVSFDALAVSDATNLVCLPIFLPVIV